jgi:hypothetical protein
LFWNPAFNSRMGLWGQSPCAKSGAPDCARALLCGRATF